MTQSKTSSILPARQIRVDQKKMLISDQERHAPKVTLHRDADCVRTIEIHCSCGEEILIDCVYEPPSTKPDPSIVPAT